MITARPEFNELVQRLRQHLQPVSIHLFGSHARGEAHPDSDVDLLVVVRESAQPRFKRAQYVRTFISDILLPKDVIVLTCQEWEEQASVPVSLVSTVIREGLELHV